MARTLTGLSFQRSQVLTGLGFQFGSSSGGGSTPKVQQLYSAGTKITDLYAGAYISEVYAGSTKIWEQNS